MTERRCLRLDNQSGKPCRAPRLAATPMPRCPTTPW